MPCPPRLACTMLGGMACSAPLNPAARHSGSMHTWYTMPWQAHAAASAEAAAALPPPWPQSRSSATMPMWLLLCARCMRSHHLLWAMLYCTRTRSMGAASLICAAPCEADTIADRTPAWTPPLDAYPMTHFVRLAKGPAHRHLDTVSDGDDDGIGGGGTPRITSPASSWREA